MIKQIQAEQGDREPSTTAQDLDWLLSAVNSAPTGDEAPPFASPSRTEPNLTENGREDFHSCPQAGPSRPRRARTIEDIAPRDTIAALVAIWFTYWHSFVPCLDPEEFTAAFDAEQDTHDVRFFGLLLALCAACCTCSHRLPIPADLAARFETWEDAARRFNSSMPPARTRDMFKLADVSVVQNIMLVSVYELAIGSSLAFHLVRHLLSSVGNLVLLTIPQISEATRFAIAYGYTSEDSSIPAKQQRLRRNIFWILFQWSIVSVSRLRRVRG